MNETLLSNLASWLAQSCHGNGNNGLNYCTVYDRHACPFYQCVNNDITCRSVTVEQWLHALKSMTQAAGGSATEFDNDAVRDSKVVAAADASAKKRGSVLLEAMKVINGERVDQYGNPEDCFDMIAEFWSSYTGVPLRGKDVAMMMDLLKIAREKTTHKRDNLRDICGYTALAADLAKLAQKEPTDA